SEGRKSFMDKKREILRSGVHWVEIDLLRTGTPSVTRPPLLPSDYRVLISRADDRHHARFWPISLRQPLPVIGIPLRGEEADIPLDLGAVLRETYEHANYDLSIDYAKAPRPALARDLANWAERLLREQGLRK